MIRSSSLEARITAWPLVSTFRSQRTFGRFPLESGTLMLSPRLADFDPNQTMSVGLQNSAGIETNDSSLPARFFTSRLFPRRSHLALSRMRDREHLTHIIGEGLAKALGIGRHWTPFVPLNGISLSHRLAPVCHADDSQSIAIRSQ